jgi:Domain of unknown function (DUF4189)
MTTGICKIPLAAILAAVLHLAAAPSARSDGAIAVGSTGDVVRHGIAFGMMVNDTAKNAPTIALERCQKFEARDAAKHCKIVATFSRQCYAVALDPEPGTPGAGWGVDKTQDAANERALTMCRETAGASREKFCKVEIGECDTRN